MQTSRKQKPSSPDRAKNTEEQAREICLRALERRMRSRWELAQRLRRKGVGVDVYEPVLDRLADVGLIDDEAFARAWIASRQRSKPRGRRGLESELRQKGIPPEVISAVLDETEQETDPLESAKKAVAPKLRSLAGRPIPEIRRKAEQFLLRRGFSYGTVRDALADLEDDTIA